MLLATRPVLLPGLAGSHLELLRAQVVGVPRSLRVAQLQVPPPMSVSLGRGLPLLQALPWEAMAMLQLWQPQLGILPEGREAMIQRDTMVAEVVAVAIMEGGGAAKLAHCTACQVAGGRPG